MYILTITVYTIYILYIYSISKKNSKILRVEILTFLWGNYISQLIITRLDLNAHLFNGSISLYITLFGGR